MRPPRLLRALLARALPARGAGASSAAGDLHEEYVALRRRRGRVAADVWYAAAALHLAVPYLVASAARGMGGAVSAAGTGLALDLRHTSRGLRRAPGTTAIAILSLGLGIGLTTTAASFVSAGWFPALPYPGAERLMELHDNHPVEVCDGCSVGTSWRAFREWQAELRAFEALEASSGGMARLGADGLTGDVRVSGVSGGYAVMLGARAALGRTILPSDDRRDAPPVLVLTHRLWTTRFGADPAVLGRSVTLDGTAHEVVGVLAPDTRLLDRSDAWVALEPTVGADARDYGDRFLWVVGRRAEGTTAAAAAAEVAALAGTRYAADASLEEGWTAGAQPLVASLREDGLPPTAAVALLAAPLLVLLIACLNLAALLLARVTDRRHELGLRVALGSGRARLARAAVLEAAVLAAAGGALGVALAAAGVRILEEAAASEAPGWVALALDLPTVAAAVLLTFLTAVVCGALPLAGSWTLHPASVVGRAATHRGPGRGRRHDLLLAAQMVLGVVLLGGAATAARTLHRVSDFDTLGHRWRGLAALTVDAPAGHHASAAQRADLAERIAGAIAARPAVTAASASAPLFLGSWGTADAASPVRVAGAAAPVPNHAVPRHSLAVLPGWLELMEIPVVAGRSFTTSDGPAAEPVAVVSADAARALWPDVEPAAVPGRAFLISDGDAEHAFTVVGVAAPVVVNVRSESRQPTPRIYTVLGQTPLALLDATPGASLAIVADVGEAGLGAARWQDVVRAVDPEVALTATRTFEESLGTWITDVRITAGGLATLALLALALLALGVYGTVAYRVATARHEIGVRLALGARRREVVTAVTGRLGRVFALALAVGAAVAVPVAAVVRGGGIPVGATDAALLGAAALLLGAVAVAGSLIPVRRALQVDPMRSLREE